MDEFRKYVLNNEAQISPLVLYDAGYAGYSPVPTAGLLNLSSRDVTVQFEYELYFCCFLFNKATAARPFFTCCFPTSTHSSCPYFKSYASFLFPSSSNHVFCICSYA
jgi:hypothetical protein